MRQEIYYTYDFDKCRCVCTAPKGEHMYCNKYSSGNGSKPCLHYRKDLDGGCDNRYAQNEVLQQIK